MECSVEKIAEALNLGKSEGKKGVLLMGSDCSVKAGLPDSTGIIESKEKGIIYECEYLTEEKVLEQSRLLWVKTIPDGYYLKLPSDPLHIFNNPKHPYTKSLLNSVPDLGDRKPFEPLTGDVPSPLQPPAACHFHPRCPIFLNEPKDSHLKQKCNQNYPAILHSEDSFVRCHMVNMINNGD